MKENHLEYILGLMFVLSAIVLFFVHGSSLLNIVAAIILVAAPMGIILARIVAFIVKRH